MNSRKKMITFSAFLWCLLIVSSVALVWVTHTIRLETNSYIQLQQGFNQLHQQRNNLLIEMNTLGSYSRIESIAISRFGLKNLSTESTVEIIYD